MNPARRQFLKYAAAAAAALYVEPAVAKPPRGQGRRGSDDGDRAESDYDAPKAPLPLGPWKHGNGSFSTETVLMFRGNPAHTFYGTGPVPDKPRQHWRYRMTDFRTELRGEPKTWAGTGWTGTAVKLGPYVFIGSVGRNLYAFEAATGQVMWRARASRMFKSSLCVYDNKLYVGNVDNRLRCFDATTGKIVWSVDMERDLDSSPCVVDGRLYIAGESGYARCMDPQTGKEHWKSMLGGIGAGSLGGSNGSETSPAIADGEYYAATYDGDLVCLQTKDGSEKWRARTNADTDASPVVSGEFVYAAAEAESSHLYCFAREDGREVWRYRDNPRGYWSTPAVADGRVWVGGDDGNLHCVDAKTGKGIWKFKTKSAVWCSPAVVEDKVVFGSIDSYLYIVDAKTGAEISSTRTDGRILSSPCVVDGHIWIGTANGWFYCFGP